MLNQKGIKGALKELIGQVALDKAIDCLKNLATTEAEYDQILSYEARHNSWQKDKQNGTITNEEDNLQRQKLIHLLLDHLKRLPDDLDLLKRKFLYLVKTKEEIPGALDFLEKLIHPDYYSKVHEFRLGQKDFETQLELEDITAEQAEVRDELQKRIKEGLTELIRALEQYHLKPNWGEIFQFLLLEEKVEPIVSYRESQIAFVENSRYLNEIREDTKSNEDARRTLLLWQEEYLSGDFEKAEEYCNAARLNYRHDTSLVYEYLSLTYLKAFPADKLVRHFLTNESESPLQKLMLYIERAQLPSDSPTETLQESFDEIYMILLGAIKKLYENISYDYAFNKASGGRSKKRDLIARCIETSILIHNRLKAYFERPHSFLEDLLLELEGGGKYLWMRFQEEDLKDRYIFQAGKQWKELLEIMKAQEQTFDSQAIGEYLLKSLNRKARNLPQAPGKGKAKERLLLACDVGYFIHKDERFNELRLAILNKITPVSLEEDASDTEPGDEMSDDSEAVKYAKRGQLTGNDGSKPQAPFTQNPSGFPFPENATSISAPPEKNQVQRFSFRSFAHLVSEMAEDIKRASIPQVLPFSLSIIGLITILLLYYRLINIISLIVLLLLVFLVTGIIYAFSRKRTASEKTEDKSIQ
ncbi:MAG: hypothetical protein H6558_22650 [Lewinellaceae bacterium]|nr:hypothetical protein [Lewinellaceae bacterium]